MFSIKTSNIPDDPHVQESHPAPEEILSISVLRYDQVNLAGPSESRDDGDLVLSARLVDKGPMCSVYGPIALLITASSRERTLSLQVLSLRTTLVVKKVDLGVGHTASLAASPRAIVVVCPYLSIVINEGRAHPLTGHLETLVINCNTRPGYAGDVAPTYRAHATRPAHLATCIRTFG